MKLNINSPLFEFLTTLADFILLNVLFIITCIPIITIGASLSALYCVTMQEARKEHGYIAKKYLKSFKQNFRQSTVIWCGISILGSIFLFNLIFWYNLKSIIGTIVLLIMIVGTALLLLCFLYIYPLIARFQNSTKQTVINSVLIALQNPKFTVLLLLLHGLYVFLCIAIPWSSIFMILLGFSFFAYCNSFLFIRAFKQYEHMN